MTSAPSPSHGPAGARLRRGLAPLLVAAVAAGYLGIGLWSTEVPAEVPGVLPPVARAALVGAQTLALVWRRQSPVVVLADLVILGTTVGGLGIGALGVIIAAYTVARDCSRRVTRKALLAAAVATAAVGGTAMFLASREPIAIQLVSTVTRLSVLYAAPVAIAELVRARGRLAEALRAQERLEEAQRREQADREVREDRAALARELHDIAGHHLSRYMGHGDGTAARIGDSF